MRSSSFLFILLWIMITSFAPFPARAQTVPGGFPTGMLWTSEAVPTAGDTLTLFSAVHDSATTSISGDIAFFVDGALVGSVPFALSPGEAVIKSVSWTASAGEHTASAGIENAVDTAKTPVALENTSAKVAFTVKDAPPPSGAAAALNTTENVITTVVASATPVVAQTANVLYSTTEALRTSGANALASALGKAPVGSTKTNNTEKQVLGASIGPVAAASAAPAPASGVVSSIVRATESGLYDIFSSRWLFYPLLLLLILILLLFLLRRLRRKD